MTVLRLDVLSHSAPARAQNRRTSAVAPSESPRSRLPNHCSRVPRGCPCPYELRRPSPPAAPAAPDVPGASCPAAVISVAQLPDWQPAAWLQSLSTMPAVTEAPAGVLPGCVWMRDGPTAACAAKA